MQCRTGRVGRSAPAGWSRFEGCAATAVLVLSLAARAQADAMPAPAAPLPVPTPAAPLPAPAPEAPLQPAANPPAPAPDTGDPTELPSRAPVRQSERASKVPSPDLGLVRKVPHGAYVHDGLFIRFAVGPGIFQSSTGRSPDTRNYSGGVVSIDGAIGGAVVPGVVIGADLQTSRVFSLSATDAVIDGDEPDLNGVRFAMNSISLFLDYYPVPTDGLHFLASIGDGWLDVTRRNTSSSTTPQGVLLTAGAGYEWFVSQSFSLGVLFRADLGLFNVDETTTGTSTGVTTFVPALLASVTYN